jgi:hypothetical protein
MQERQITKNTRNRADRQCPVTKTAPAGNFPTPADNPRLRSTNHHQLSTRTGFVTRPAHARYAKSHHLENFIFTIITTRFIVAPVWEFGGAIILSLDTTGKKLASQGCLYDQHSTWGTPRSTSAFGSTRHHQIKSIACYCSGRLPSLLPIARA